MYVHSSTEKHVLNWFQVFFRLVLTWQVGAHSVCGVVPMPCSSAWQCPLMLWGLKCSLDPLRVCETTPALSRVSLDVGLYQKHKNSLLHKSVLSPFNHYFYMYIRKQGYGERSG